SQNPSGGSGGMVPAAGSAGNPGTSPAGSGGSAGAAPSTGGTATGGGSEPGGTGGTTEPQGGASGGMPEPPLPGEGGTAGTGSGGSGNATAEGGTGGEVEPEEPPPSLIGDVAFSTPSQSFMGTLPVELTTAIAGAEIRYTVDGTLPTASSPLYAGPIQLTETTQLRAQPFTEGLPSGAVSTAVYIARTFEFTSDLPIVLVDGYGGGKPEDKEV